ncbi:MAG TPA: phytanoyl-CoA dioxygenase family protein [Chitinophagales bacterium]|nr:phytanoyl-CoA dioxygenase family protein [Chitinophagales bacterium]
MRKVLRDPELQEQFNRDGYVVVPFLTPEDIQKIKAVYDEFSNPSMDNAFYISIMSRDAEYRKQIHQRISEIVWPRANYYLDDYRFINCSFAVKRAGMGAQSEFDIHSGITFTDEKKFVSITIWSPLQDVGLENGCMYALKGSHKLYSEPRKSPAFKSPFRNIKEYLKNKYITYLPMKAGEGFLFDHRLIHGSPPNNTNQVRIATLNALTPKESPILLYTNVTPDLEDGNLKVYEFKKDNYYMLDVATTEPDVPEVELVGYDKEIVVDWTPESFDQMYKESYLQEG